MEYNIVKYANIGKVKSGKRLPKGEVVSELVSNNKYIRVRDITGNMINSKDVQYITDVASEKIKNYRVKTNDIIISVVGTVGSIAEIPSELNGAYLTENCDNLLVNEKICLKKYLKHYLISKYGQEQVIANTVGSTQPKLPIYGIENFDIVLPDINIQNKIVKILDAFDNKILINNQINDNLHNMQKHYFKKLFKEKAYKELKLDDLCVISAGGDAPKDKQEFKSNEYVYPIVSNGIDNDGIYGYSKEYKIDKKSVTISARGTIGYKILRNYKFYPIVRLITLTPKDESISSEYLYYALDNVQIIGTGTTQQQLTIPMIKDISIKVYDKDLIRKFTDYSITMNNKIENNKWENEELSQLRDTLSPKLMNGEIDLDKVEI